MLTAIVAIIDRLIGLMKQRDERRKVIFKELVEPLYVEAQVIAKDYRLMFAKLADGIRKDPYSLESALSELRAARQECMDTRIKLRELMAAYADEASSIKPFLERLGDLLQAPLDRSPSYFLVEFSSTQLALVRHNEISLEDAVSEILQWVDELTAFVERNWIELTYQYGVLKMSHALPS